MVMYKRFREMSWMDILEKLEDPRLKWDYITALRACDYMSNTTKILFNCFIRGRNKWIHTGYRDIRNFEELVLSKELEEIADNLIMECKDMKKYGVFDHYMDHIRLALIAIYDYLEEYISYRLLSIAGLLRKIVDSKNKAETEQYRNEIIQLLKEIRDYVDRVITV